MHGPAVTIDIEQVLEAEPIRPHSTLTGLMWVFVLIGMVTFTIGLRVAQPAHVWAVYYVNLVFFMGLSCGAVIFTAILQIVRAKWSAPVSRIAEAAVAFLPWAYLLFLGSYLGKEYLFPWARAPMPGREWWMQANFVYARFAVLLAFLFFMMNRFVKMSLRADVGFCREKAKNKERWSGACYTALTENWQGSDAEVAAIQPKRSWNAPLLIALYAAIYSLFAFEMVMAMDTVWYANMFGGFTIIGNIYMGLAVLGLSVVYLVRTNSDFAKVVTTAQLWDMGKLTFAFCMLWGYMFWAQFLPQWYGNLPEETQWMILRTREFPWKGWGWFVFPMCFILPFILLLSRDLKKTPRYFASVCALIFFGMWMEKYLIIMPQFSPTAIPFSCSEIGIFLGFLGVYVLAVTKFLSKYPFVQISHPTMVGKTTW